MAGLIYNPYAGRAGPGSVTVDWLIDRLSEIGISVRMIAADGVHGVPRDLELMCEDDLLIIAGGDGTIYEAIQSSKIRRLRVAIIPLGTANNLAVSAGVPLDPESAVHAISHGYYHLVDLGRVGDRVFTQAAGVGLHAAAFHAYGHRRDRSLPDAVRAFRQAVREWQARVVGIDIDGVIFEEEVTQITIANTPVYGRGLLIAPEAEIDDGFLDVVIIGRMTPKDILRGVVDLMEGRDLIASKLTRVRARCVRVFPVSDAPVPVHADAEPIGYAPIDVEVLPSCLRLIVPG